MHCFLHTKYIRDSDFLQIAMEWPCLLSYFSFFFKIHCLAFVLLPSVNTKPLSAQLMLHLSQLFQWGVRELQIFRCSHMKTRTNPGASLGLAKRQKLKCQMRVWAENEKEGVKSQACRGGQCYSAGSGGGRNKGSLLHGSLPQLWILSQSLLWSMASTDY